MIRAINESDIEDAELRFVFRACDKAGLQVYLHDGSRLFVGTGPSTLQQFDPLRDMKDAMFLLDTYSHIRPVELGIGDGTVSVHSPQLRSGHVATFRASRTRLETICRCIVGAIADI